MLTGDAPAPEPKDAAVIKGLLGLAAVALTAAAAAAQGYLPGYPTPPGYGGAYPGGYGGYPGGAGGGYPGGYGGGAGYGGAQQGNFLPNYYNRQTQPLSPYLNLLRGGNAATNYFYGVRPGTTQGGGLGGGFGGPGSSLAYRGGFIPAASNPAQEPVTLATNQQLPYIPSAAHPVYYAAPPGRYNGGAGAIGSNRAGITGSQKPAAGAKPTPPR